MKKVLISINNNQIGFSYDSNKSKINKDLINTNIISNNELIFSDVYIKDNYKILSSFIKELAVQYNINKVVISKIELAELVLPLLMKAIQIEEFTLLEDEALTYNICELLIKIEHIKHINCYALQPFMIELLDKHNIMCDTRSEILYISNFMESNNLIRYSNIYYKTNVRITFPFTLEDLKDFRDFCKINKYLKVIHVNKLINSELESLVKILSSLNRRNIKIVIHENISDEKTANYLRDLNKTYKRKYHIYLTLEYTKDYLDKNIFAQTIANMLKVCGLIICSLIILVVTYVGVSNYIALKDVDSIKDNLAQVIENTPDEKVKNIIDEQQEKVNEEALEKDVPKDNIKLITNAELASLLPINQDIVGHLTVNNTNVDYPVVQTKDNDYYLEYDLNRKKTINGWIFMDYRNNSMNMDKNTIIYGHNVYYSGVMFGTLYKVANKSWYTNPENQIITYDSLYENMQFKIFSIYRVPKTNDYLKVVFKDDKDFLDFADMITKRSIYDFKVPVNAEDKILTLSTCSDNGSKRLVVHAVLVKN